MTRWKKDETRFTVKICYNDESGCQTRIPKPILEKLGNPSTITFIVENNQIKVI